MRGHRIDEGTVDRGSNLGELIGDAISVTEANCIVEEEAAPHDVGVVDEPETRFTRQCRRALGIPTLRPEPSFDTSSECARAKLAGKVLRTDVPDGGLCRSQFAGLDFGACPPCLAHGHDAQRIDAAL